MFWDWYSEERGLDEFLHTAVHMFQDARRDYWREHENEKILKIVDEAGENIVAAGLSLFGDREDTETLIMLKLAKNLTAIETIDELVRERIQLELALEFSGRTAEMAERCLELARLFATAAPNEQVMRFVRRLSRSYIAGFFPETIILCRGVLENGVKDVFNRKNVSLPSEMRLRLEWAERAKWIAPHTRNKAWTVWQRGNTAVHKDPEAVGDALGTIEMTVAALEELYAGVE